VRTPRALSAVMMVLLAGVARAQPKPVLSAPPAFSQGEAGDASHLEAQAWWEAFGDPTLTSLVRRATGGSLTLQQAKARIRQARAALGSAKADQWPSVTATAQASRSQTSSNAVTPTEGSTLSLDQILDGIVHGNPIAVIDLGIVILIATPLVRIVAAGITFGLERDYRFLGVSIFVLAMIVLAVFIKL